MSTRLDKYLDAKYCWALIARLGLDHDPETVDLYERAQSPIRQHAEKAVVKLAAHLEKQIALMDAMRNEPEARPAVPSAVALIVGYEFYDPVTGAYESPIQVDLNGLAEHLAIFGASGTGKTSFFRFIADQLVQKEIPVEFFDYKGEGRSIPNAMVFRVDQYPCNMLEPRGKSNIYYPAFFAEFATAFSLRPETWTELPRVMLSIERGLKAGDPYPSLKDFERLLPLLADHQNNPKLRTAGMAVAALNAILGESAYIRKSPDISNRYPFLVHDYEGLPMRIYSFLNAIHLLRAQMKASVEGHA